MFDLNLVTIKGADDFQESLQVKHDLGSFKQNINFYIDKYGLDEALTVLGIALLGDSDNLKPLIKFKQKIVWSGDPYDEGHLELIEQETCGKCGDTLDHIDTLSSAGHDLE